MKQRHAQMIAKNSRLKSRNQRKLVALRLTKTRVAKASEQ